MSISPSGTALPPAEPPPPTHKVLTYADKPNDPAQLFDELAAAFPAWITDNPDGTKTYDYRVESRGDDLRLTVPYAADEPAVDAVVAAHVPTGPRASDNPYNQIYADVQSARGALKTALDHWQALPASPTAAQLKQVLGESMQAQRDGLKALSDLTRLVRSGGVDREPGPEG